MIRPTARAKLRHYSWHAGMARHSTHHGRDGLEGWRLIIVLNVFLEIGVHICCVSLSFCYWPARGIGFRAAVQRRAGWRREDRGEERRGEDAIG